MSTIEKLFVQIFERKSSIIEQVRHQVDLYDQQLASNLVIQGIDPPSWLWNHEAPSRSFDPLEIDKQRLISELLLPQQAVPYFSDFNYNNTSIPEFTFDHLVEPVNLTCFDDVCDVPGVSMEVKPAAFSPQQAETRLVDGNGGFDLSLSEFTRSKSRQRDLELRSSAKRRAKSGAQDGNISAVSYRNDRPGVDEFVRSSHIKEPDSAKDLNIQLDGNAKYEGINSNSCTDREANKMNENICVLDEHSFSITEVVGAVFTEQVNKPIHLESHLNIPRESDSKSEGVVAQSCIANDSIGSLPILHLHHGKSVDQTFKRNNFGDESSERINKSTMLSDNLGIFREGDVEFEGSDVRFSEENHTSDAPPNQGIGHVCSSIDHICDSDTKNLGAVSRDQIYKPTQFQETLDIQFGDAESKNSNTFCSSKEDNVCEAIPSQPLNHELDSTEQDFGCTRTLGVVTVRWIDENSVVEILSAVAQGNCSLDATLGVHSLSNLEEVPFPSKISSSKIIGDSDFDMMKEQTDGPSSGEKRLRKLTANPVITEISLGKSSDFTPNFPAEENDAIVIGVSSACNPSQSLHHVLQPPHAANLAAVIASPKSTGVKLSELRTLSCGLECGNSPIQELKELKTEVEVPQLQSETDEQLDLVKEDAHLTACDYPLYNGVVQYEEKLARVRSASCNGSSKASKDSYHIQDDIGVEEDSKSEATSPLLKSTSMSFSKILNELKTQSLRFSSHEAQRATDDSLMIEKTSGSVLLGSHLSLHVQENLNEEHSKSETFSIESALELESYVANVNYDGLMDTDQSMPVLESFAVDPYDEESLFAGGQTDIEESSLPGSTSKRASFLERLCQSSSRNTPISQFPMTYGLHKISDLFQSVPTGLLEHISPVIDCSNMKLQQKSNSAGLPVSTRLSVSTPYASPFKKKWDHKASSSGLRSLGSSNPELVCFTIEEDSGNCDEIVNLDAAAEAPPRRGSCLKSSTKREPLTDITEDVNSPCPSVSVHNKDVLEAGHTPKYLFRSQPDTTGTDANLTGAQTRARQKLRKNFSNKKRRLNDAKESRNILVGATGCKLVTDSQRDAKSLKPKHLENLKATTVVGDQPKVLRSTNIVSNVSSFIPLVQQKKAAAVIKVKRDVKVKALEAAEAAKRLAEKKENERKAKKEAWKAEKIKLEQENLLLLELKKKKKEEELKKKEAEMAVRKRMREEEEKKEKEGKRMRIEEARKQRNEQEKKQADKLTRHQADKLTRPQADGFRIHNKDPNNRLEQCPKMETGGRRCGITTENEDKSTAVPCETKTRLCDLKESKTLTKADIGDSSITMVVSDFNATAEKNPKNKVEILQSYDISPYQSSDDEDEDDENENERRKGKFVPAWASKNNLAEAIFFQQQINPDEILPPESFCSITEVLVPRKLPIR